MREVWRARAAADYAAKAVGRAQSVHEAAVARRWVGWADDEHMPMMPSQQGQGPGAIPPMAPGAPAGQPQPYRQLKVEDALAYLDQVKIKFEKQPHIYNQVHCSPPLPSAPPPKRVSTARCSFRMHGRG